MLKPGGVFYFAEPSYGRIHRGMYCLLGHPKDAGFTADELRSALVEAGLQPTSASSARRCGTWWASRGGQ